MRYNASVMAKTPARPDPPAPGTTPAPPESATDGNMVARLEALRQHIDTLDEQLVALLNERAKVVVKIGQVKRDDNAPVYSPERERRVLKQIRDWNTGPLPNSCVEAIWREVMSGSFVLEKPLRIGYLGPPGTFSHLAARRKFGASIEYDNLDSIHAVFEEITRGHIDLGMVPIENSTEGSVSDTLDSFVDSAVRIYAEVLINIHHNLLANCDPEQIERVYSHPQALAQCRKWLSVQLHQAERIPVASTSKAAELAADDDRGAAIGSPLAGEIFGLKTQFADIEDNPKNTTRFFVIGKQAAPRSGDDKTAIMFTTVHKPGSLSQVLDVFRDQDLNLTHIDKRPSQRVNWEYYFFVDFLGHGEDQNVRAAIETARKHCLQLTVLGSFPRAEDMI